MKILKAGRTLAPGIAIGRAYLPETHDKRAAMPDTSAVSDPVRETELFEAAVRDAVERMESVAADEAVVAAPAGLADDALFVGAVEEKISREGMSAGRALQSTCKAVGDMLSASGDEYFRRAAGSFAEACARISEALEDGPGRNPFAEMPQGAVLVAEGLTVRDTELMDFARVAGLIVTDRDAVGRIGIVARAKGVPAVAVADDELVSIADGQTVVLDASRGEVILSPDPKTEEDYLILADDYKEENRRLSGIELPGAVTTDGRRVTVLAVAASASEVGAAVEAGADGIGMLESGLSSGSSFTEEEIFGIYRECARICGQRPLIIRTMKPAFFRDRRADGAEVTSEMLEAQLRAILRAGRFGNVKLLFPSVESVDEFRSLSSVLEKCREQLSGAGAEYDETMAAGVTVETLQAVLIADALASEARFICIAADGLAAGMDGTEGGGRPQTVPEYFPTPSVVRAVKAVADSSAAAGADCELCGRSVSDTRLTALLLGLGIDTMCVEASSIGSLKKHIESLNYADCRALAFRALGTVTDAQMKELVF